MQEVSKLVNELYCCQGYRKTNSTSCVPECNPSCVGGICTLPEQCACLPSYIKTNLSHVCIPVCSKPCDNGTCVAPEKCECNKGFQKNMVNGTQKCDPVCSKPCVNGFCSAPDTCTCFDQYTKTRDPSICEPVCSKGCVNSLCSLPEKCECLEGYMADLEFNNICHPACSTQCQYALCQAPETCVCLEGYAPTQDPFTCAPICSEPCVEGNASPQTLALVFLGIKSTKTVVIFVFLSVVNPVRTVCV